MAKATGKSSGKSTTTASGSGAADKAPRTRGTAAGATKTATDIDTASKARGRAAAAAPATKAAKPSSPRRASAAGAKPPEATEAPAAPAAKAAKPASPRRASAAEAKPPSATEGPAAPAAKAAKPSSPRRPSGARPAATKAASEAKAPATRAARQTGATATPARASRKQSAAAEARPDVTSAEPATAKTAAAGGAAGRKPGASRTRTPVIDRPWLLSYPDEIPSEIPPLADASIGELLVRACRTYASRPAFTCMDKTLTFAEIDSYSEQFAAYLQSKGLAKGARVALMMPNVLQYPIALMGALRAGYTVVNVNPLYTPRELEHQLVDSGAEAIVILENFASTLEKVIAKTPVKHVVVASLGDMLGFVKGMIVNLVVRRVRKLVPSWSLPGHVRFNDALAQGAGGSLKAVEVGPDDIAFLQYTGGTTGVSKGAMLLHRNVLANVSQNELWVQAAYRLKGKPERMVYVCALPLYHIYALTVNALMGMQQGARNILIPNPRDIPGFVKELQKYPFNVFPGLNTLFNALLNNEDFRKLDFKPMLLTFGGGMAVQRTVADRWKELTGIIISEGYGLSETSPVATANRFDATEFSGTIGLPIPSTEIAIRDEEGKDLPFGEVGEICIRGPQVMAGYWNRPDETAKVMTDDGFFKSGDMGFLDESGFVKIVDRKKDMILVSGFNVYPNEIEEVVASHPGVLEVAAIGVPDEKSGEVPKIFVVRKDENLTADAIIEFTKDKLTAYKRPRHVEFRKDLPKTNVGKILRRELR